MSYTTPQQISGCSDYSLILLAVCVCGDEISSVDRDRIWHELHDAWGEPISGAMPHNVYCYIITALSTLSEIDYVEPVNPTTETYHAADRSFTESAVSSLLGLEA